MSQAERHLIMASLPPADGAELLTMLQTDDQRDLLSRISPQEAAMLLVELKGSIVTRESTLALMSPEMRSNVEAKVTASLAIQICSHLRSGQPHFAVIALKQMSVSDGIRTMDALRPEEAAEVLGAHLHNHE